MVRYLGPKSVAQLVLASRPEIVTVHGKVDAWLVGSGIDPELITPAERDMILQAVMSGQPVVMDAGALSFLLQTTSPAIITPHEGELERILPQGNDSLEEWAARAASVLGVVVVLKSHTTWIACPSDGNSETFLRSVTSSTTWLATAGTGDVLAGTIASVLATQSAARSEEKPLTLDDLAAIAATGVFLHSIAAGKASEEGPFPALDVAHCLSQAVKELTG
jgi:NAD(P)H-hydrate repair Nnr-like enzyme with NAD(P)H-hydrate dehydratase domain